MENLLAQIGTADQWLEVIFMFFGLICILIFFVFMCVKIHDENLKETAKRLREEDELNSFK